MISVRWEKEAGTRINRWLINGFHEADGVIVVAAQPFHRSFGQRNLASVCTHIQSENEQNYPIKKKPKKHAQQTQQLCIITNNKNCTNNLEAMYLISM